MSPEHNTSKSKPELVVCPECHYGFPSSEGASRFFVCPRPQCQHRWDALTPTLQAVHGQRRRRAQPELHVVAGANPAVCEIPPGEALIGRDENCQLCLENKTVSRFHARLDRQDDRTWIEDLQSSWGTNLNGCRIENRTELTAGDEIVVGGITIAYLVRFEPTERGQRLVDNSILIAKGAKLPAEMDGEATQTIALRGTRLTIGRAKDRDLVLPDLRISRRHAVLDFDGGSYFLSDAQSRLGTYVNGKSIIRARLDPGDRIQLGTYLFRFEGDRLVRIVEPQSFSLVASRLIQTAGTVRLLDDITLEIKSSEFIGLLGPSGAGKSTLLDALRRAAEINLPPIVV